MRRCRPRLGPRRRTRRLYRPSEIRAFRTNPSIVSPPTGAGITGSRTIACADVGRSRRRQPDHVQHQGGAVVGAAGVEGGRDQRAGGILGRGALAQDFGDALLAQKPMHPVAAQQKPVVHRHRLRGVIKAHLGLDPERAGERVRATSAILAHMVGRQAAQAVTAEPIGAGIPDMQQVGDAAAQHQAP